MQKKYKPKTKKELVEIIKKEIYKIQGTPDNPNWEADLNCIDTSKITDMSYLFSKEFGLNKFNGNISNWNTSNVENMQCMFQNSKFNQNISNWNVGNVKDMSWMFLGSNFNQDINKWKLFNLKKMKGMFANSFFNKEIDLWNLSIIEDVDHIFINSKFNKDIGNLPKYIKNKLYVKNISISEKYSRLPDKIKYPQTIANIFNFVIDNPNSKEITKNQAVNIMTEWLNNRQKEYINKGLDKKTVKQLLINDFLDILKNIKNRFIILD